VEPRCTAPATPCVLSQEFFDCRTQVGRTPIPALEDLPESIDLPCREFGRRNDSPVWKAGKNNLYTQADPERVHEVDGT
jgi:hypothetical protein